MYKRYIRKIIISFILLFAMLINSIYPLYNDGNAIKWKASGTTKQIDIKYDISLAKDYDAIEEDTPLYYSIEYDEVLDGYYRRYYVSTADQLAARNRNVTLEIDGNGHRLYSGYYGAPKVTGVKYNTGAAANQGASVENTYYENFLNQDYMFYIHDLVFSKQYIGHEQGMFASGVRYAYFNNVNWKSCMAVGGSSTVIVLGHSYGRCYFKDCTIDNSYIYGNAHCGLFASYNEGATTYDNASYIGDTAGTYNAYYYTDIPNDVSEVYRAWNGYKSELHKDVNLYIIFPSIYEDCATVNSEVYDYGANHSGTFVSCLQAMIIFKNCFSNCNIYARTQL